MYKKIIKNIHILILSLYLLITASVVYASENLGNLLIDCEIEEVSEDSWFYRGYYFTSRLFDKGKNKRIVIQRLLNHPRASDFKEFGYDTTLNKINIYNESGELFMILDRRNLKLKSITYETETNCKIYDGYLEDML